MSTHTYENLDGSRVIWYCNACGEANYSECHLFSSSSIECSNSFGSLSSPNEDGSFELGSPKATSSPVHSNKNQGNNPTAKLQGNKNINRGSKNESLRFLVINFQSVRAKREAFHACVDTNKPHIIIGTESWLSDEINNNEIFPPDFTAIRKDRNSNDGRGGVFVAIRNDLIGTHQVELDTECEIVLGAHPVSWL